LNKVGLIRWPLRLFDDAADYDYTNDAIQEPLYNAYSSIYDILTGHRPHEIVALFSAHMAKEKEEFQAANPKRSLTTNDLISAGSCFPFHVPILPGDASLVVDFVANLLQHAKNVNDEVDKCAVQCIGRALFSLVILRTYLGRPPENDEDIFHAVKNGLISRVWTSHEQALAACYGAENTSPEAVFDTMPDPGLWGIKVMRDVNLQLAVDRPFVTLKQPIAWTSGPGLTGGHLKPRRYRPPSQQLKPGPRPKPCPAFSQKPAVDTNMPADADVTTYTSIRRPANMMVEVEKPVAKLKSTAEHHTSQCQAADGEGAKGPLSGMPAKVRRGERQRKVVRF